MLVNFSVLLKPTEQGYYMKTTFCLFYYSTFNVTYSLLSKTGIFLFLHTVFKCPLHSKVTPLPRFAPDVRCRHKLTF